MNGNHRTFGHYSFGHNSPSIAFHTLFDNVFTIGPGISKMVWRRSSGWKSLHLCGGTIALHLKFSVSINTRWHPIALKFNPSIFSSCFFKYLIFSCILYYAFINLRFHTCVIYCNKRAVGEPTLIIYSNVLFLMYLSIM